MIKDENGGSIGSLTNDHNFLVVTMILIFFGSIGYPIVFELLRNIKMVSLSKFKELHLSLNSKIVIFSTSTNSSKFTSLLAKVFLDIKEGADFVMVKPGMPYLDIISHVI